jgi:hypothetical protein
MKKVWENQKRTVLEIYFQIRQYKKFSINTDRFVESFT